MNAAARQALHARMQRRSLLAAGLAAPALAADPWAGLAELCHAAMRARLTPDDAPCLLLSWEAGMEGDFARTHRQTAYVYDNALAGLAFLAMGDAASARRIGLALALNQDTDRHFRDGRLRNAYVAGPPTARLPGWWDAAAARWVEDGYQVGTATGVVAWAMLLWLALDETLREPPFRAAARRAADWVAATQRVKQGFRGGFIGHEPNPAPLAWVSTEHNIDLVAAFGRLGRREEAAHAAAFVESMWDAGERRYLAGLTPDGALNRFSALDANLWPLIARDMPPARRGALDWVRAYHAAGDGFDFNDDRDGAWTEGTAIAALALRMAGQDEAAARAGGFLRRQVSASGLLYATDVPSLSTGLSTGIDPTKPDFRYPRLPHLAPTAWAVLAARLANPFARMA